jgi:GH24 family phage-related lysozyme (muramidase)
MANRLVELERALERKRQPANRADAQSLSAHRFGGWSRGQTAPSILATAFARAKQFEGSINHLYLDTNGAVHVGVGRMLPDSAAAAKLDFLHNTDDSPASAQEKVDEFAAVEGKQPNKLASFYKQFTTLHLTQATIDTLLTDDLVRSVGSLEARLPDYATYPVSVQEALLDMMFNLGESRLMKRFPKFIAAIKSKDFKTAAKECHRLRVGSARNDEIRQLLTSAIPSPSPTP